MNGWENEKKLPEDIGLVKAPGFDKQELLEAFTNVAKVTKKRPKSVIVEVNTYRKYVPLLLDAYIRMCEGLRKSNMVYQRSTDIKYARGNKKWTADEDNELIEQVCREDMNIHQLSAVFGRSPGAIKTHISELVGRKKLSQEVAGRFIGLIDGENVDAEINGTIYKKED